MLKVYKILVLLFLFVIFGCNSNLTKEEKKALWDKAQTEGEIVRRSGTPYNIDTHRELALADAENRLISGGGLFGKDSPLISSTKSLTGHSLGAAGVQESIYSLIMLNEGFLCASANIDNIDERISEANILRKNKPGTFKKVMSNSFGFGGTNACLVFEALN